MKSTIILALMFVVAFIGCGEKKTEPVPVGEMNEYRDPGYGFKIKYPKEWKQWGTTGKPVFARSQEVLNKFLDPRSGEPGAEVSIEVMRNEGKSAAERIQSAKDDMKQLNMQLSPDERVTVAGREATRIPYMIKATTKTNINGHQLFVPGDTATYRLDFIAWGDQYEAHSAVFDAMLKSFDLPVVVAKKSDVFQPSASVETFNSQFFSFEYPDNMESMPVSKGNFDFSVKMRADRLDCSIQVDVFGAKGLTVDKVWEQNKGRFRARNTGEASIGGIKAIWVEYSPIANIMSRTYFIVKNDKVVRPTVTWYQPQHDVYFPVFEGVVKSMKLK